MRDIGHECWPSCDRCERQLPTLDANHRLTLGWTQPVPGTDLCASCSELWHCTSCGNRNPSLLTEKTYVASGYRWVIVRCEACFRIARHELAEGQSLTTQESLDR